LAGSPNLQCHVGGPWHQQRKSGDYTLPDVYLSICGGFQPDVVAEVLARRPGKADSGMAARFSLLVWPDHMPRKWVDNSPDRELRVRVVSLFSRLLSKNPEGFVGPRPEGASHFPPLRFRRRARSIPTRHCAATSPNSTACLLSSPSSIT
jgi:Protein of unknown function (DUF3987)